MDMSGYIVSFRAHKSKLAFYLARESFETMERSEARSYSSENMAMNAIRAMQEYYPIGEWKIEAIFNEDTRIRARELYRATAYNLR